MSLSPRLNDVSVLFVCVVRQPTVFRQISASFGEVLRVLFPPPIVPGTVEALVEYDSATTAEKALVRRVYAHCAAPPPLCGKVASGCG